MSLLKPLVLFLVLLIVGSGSAFAHGGRAQVGVYFGPMWGGPVFYPPLYYQPYYQPQVVIVPAAPPPVYIERSEAPPDETAAPTQQYWYYCSAAKGYYPYVKECPNGWQKVLPQPQR